jgi:S1-C subfamily serine protease
VRATRLLVAIAALALLGASGCTVTGLRVTQSGTSSGVGAAETIQTVPQVSSSSFDAQAIAAKVDPAVVDIDTVTGSSGRQSQAAGTGMVLRSSGLVLTNNHVVEGATSIKVTATGRSGSHKASVVGTDPAADVAVLQVDGVSGLPTVTLADSSTLSVGQRVVAIGNALGRGGTPTASEGTITALDRSITASDGGGSSEQLSGLIETDAPISPGESGGPLVNSSGQVVGMITAGTAGRFRRALSRDGFAIPASTAISVVNQIVTGKPGPTVVLGQPGYLGVQVRDLDSTSASRLGISSGVLVVGVVTGSPAEQAGISAGSAITAIDGNSVGSVDALGPAIRKHKPGERMQVTWRDEAGSHTATATLVAGLAT